jgi:hypothetical protein
MITKVLELGFLKSYLLFLVLHCSSIQIDLVSSRENLVIYNLEGSTKKNLIHFSDQDLKYIFSLMETKSKTISLKEKESLFSKEQVDEFILSLNELKNNYSNLLIIQKEDDLLSPKTRILRTSFVLNILKEGIKIDFLEIRNSINFGYYYTTNDWTSISLVKKKCITSPSIFISKLENFSYYEIDKNCSSEKNFNSIILDYQKFINKDAKVKTPSKDISKRLEELKTLFKKKLITKHDYEKKKAEILDEL